MVRSATCRLLLLAHLANVIGARRPAYDEASLLSELSGTEASGAGSGKRRKTRRYPILCDPEIVASTCAAVNTNTEDYFKTAADDDSSILHAHEIADQLSVSTDQVVAYLKSIKVDNVEKDAAALEKHAFAVKCGDLCSKTVESIPKKQRPTSSDVGCMMADEHADKPTCDIDLSDAAMDAIEFTDRGERRSEKMFAEHRKAPAEVKTKPKKVHDIQVASAKKVSAKRPRAKPKTVDDSWMQRAVANLFRIYPVVSSTMNDRLDEEKVSEALHAADAMPKARTLPKPKLKSSLAEGPSYSTPNEQGCVDKALTGYVYDGTDDDIPCSELAADGSCDDDEEVKEICAASCGLTCSPPAPPAPGSWKYDVLKVSVKAQAYIARALRKMAAKQVPHRVIEWFGNNDEATRKKVKTIMNGVSGMLGNVEYVFPGPDCDDDTFAYVEPESPDNVNNRGNYIYYLCPLYMKSTEDVQIETLTHEGSHHESMFTDDVCAPDVEDPGEEQANCEDNRAYGRGVCLDLAKQFPERAVRNADTYCFFVNDVNEAPYTGGCIDKVDSGIVFGDEEPPCGSRIKEYCNDEDVGSTARSNCPASCRLDCGGDPTGKAKTAESTTLTPEPIGEAKTTAAPKEHPHSKKSRSPGFAPGCWILAALLVWHQH